jgi:hypothetical protein
MSDVSKVTVTSTYAYVSKRWVRPKETSPRAGAFKLYADQRQVGVLPALGSYTFEVAPGPHTLRVHFRWFRSRRLEFDAVDSGDVRFTTTVPKSFASFLRLIFRPFSAIELSRSFGA